jgi:hypothetical protein
VNKTDIMHNAMMKLRTASDQLNEMNAFSVEFDEGIEFAVMQINKVIQYLSAVSKTESELSNA